MKNFSLFFNFDGEAREAMDFYAQVFQSEMQELMTYGEMPPDSDFPIAEGDKARVMYAYVPIYGMNVMFCDTPSGMPFVRGSSISPTLGSDDQEEIRRAFAALAQGGTVDMPLAKTFWSELYGMVTDKFGITWQFSHDCTVE